LESKKIILLQGNIKNLDKISNLYIVKNEIKNRNKNAVFVDITKKKEGLFPMKTKVDLNLKTDFNQNLK